MVDGLWGKKIGMTQIFSDDHTIVPVTVIDVADWFVTQVKTAARDGYDAVQIGRVRERYSGQAFSPEWLTSLKKYFSTIKEVRFFDEVTAIEVGQVFDIASLFDKGAAVDVFGITIGRGFQGGVKRHGFKGGRASHGDKLGRGPGSIGYMRSRGRVIKGQRMAGHMGLEQRVMKNLTVMQIEPTAKIMIIKGSVPGKSGSLVFVRKCR